MRDPVLLGEWRQRGAVTRLDAARILGISPRNLDKMLKRKEIESKKSGRRVLVPVHELRRFLGEAPDLRTASSGPALSDQLPPHLRRKLERNLQRAV